MYNRSRKRCPYIFVGIARQAVDTPTPLWRGPLAHKLPRESTREMKNGAAHDYGVSVGPILRTARRLTRPIVQLIGFIFWDVILYGGWRAGAICPNK
jgi:hypothetical protein